MEMVNNRGPRIDPWGTPQKRGAREEEAFFPHRATCWTDKG